MMDKIFFRILNMSLVSGYVIVLLLLLRPLFGRVSRRLTYALWGVALFRLLCPFSVAGLISLVPVQPNTVSVGMLYEQNPQIHSGIHPLTMRSTAFCPPQPLNTASIPYRFTPLSAGSFGSPAW